MKVTITAPHSKFSGPTEVHMADWIAGDVAIELYRLMGCAPSLYLAHEVRALAHAPHVYMQDVYRRLIDLNRPESRGTQWRMELARTLRHTELLLDIHSFPSSDNEAFDFGVFEIPGITNEVLLRHFSDELRANGWLVQRMAGGYENDIAIDAHQRGVDALLIEVNESLDPLIAAKGLKDVVDVTSRSMIEKIDDWGDEALIAIRWCS